MKLFSGKCTSTSYKCPICKLTVSLFIIFSAIFISGYIPCNNGTIRTLISLVTTAMVIPGFYGLYCALGELGDVYFNRKKAKARAANPHPFSIHTVLKIAKENDTVALKVYGQKRTITLGTTAPAQAFTGKRFYIEGQAYEKAEDFAQALMELFPDGMVPLFTIDGLPPRHWVYSRPKSAHPHNHHK